MDEFPNDGELIQSKKMDIEEAWKIPILLLRWQNRICKKCNLEFDILKEGRFYLCGECL